MLTKEKIFVDTHFQYVHAGVSRLNKNRHLTLTREEELIQLRGEFTLVNDNTGFVNFLLDRQWRRFGDRYQARHKH